MTQYNDNSHYIYYEEQRCFIIIEVVIVYNTENNDALKDFHDAIFSELYIDISGLILSSR